MPQPTLAESASRIRKLVRLLESDPSLRHELTGARGPSDVVHRLVRVARERRIELQPEELEAVVSQALSGMAELSPDDLAAVSGGRAARPEDVFAHVRQTLKLYADLAGRR
jgi:hypothetical protein